MSVRAKSGSKGKRWSSSSLKPYTPGGLIVMLAEYGTASLAEVLEPAMQMAAGYPIERAQADNMERRREILSQWPASKRVFLPHLDETDPEQRAAPHPGEIFRQPDLLRTLEKLVEAESRALAAGKGRKDAILAAYDRFYRGDIAEELVRASHLPLIQAELAAGGMAPCGACLPPQPDMPRPRDAISTVVIVRIPILLRLC